MINSSISDSQVRYREYLNSDYWKTVTKAVKARAGYRCQVCNSEHDLQAHHRRYVNRGQELNHLDDLVCLCRRCHALFHGKLSEPVAPLPVAKPQRAAVAYVPATPVSVEHEMPPGDGPITLTHELVTRTLTERGGRTDATIEALGVEYPLVQGWPFRLVGKVVTREAYRAALLGRYSFKKRKRRR